MAEREEKSRMSLSFDSVRVPLRQYAPGVYCVGDSGVALGTVIDQFVTGEQQPQSIVDNYPTLRLDDVYAVIAYYLQNRAEVDEYLRRREDEAEELRQKIEAKQQPKKQDFIKNLRTRKTNTEQTLASSDL